jgi:arylsulfatase A
MALGAGCMTVLPRLGNGNPDGGKVKQPNIVYILADDLGFGDVACFNRERSRIPTPNLDRLAKEGMVFTDAHASSSICTPSRYAILTGRYNWRSPLQRGIVWVYGEPLIAPDRLTVAGFLRQQGYHTACIGKWHLGWNWPMSEARKQQEIALGGYGKNLVATVSEEHRAGWREMYSKPISGGPTARGFDHYFGVDVPNWPPYCWIENDRTVGIPSEPLPLEKLVPLQADQQGPAMPGWQLEKLLPTLAEHSCQYIAKRAAAREPFFLYLPLTSPHTPLAVNEEWRGKSGLNLYADLVMETDANVGRVLQALEDNGVADNTLVIFTSDNGCAHYVGAAELEAKGHFPSAQFRGYKSDAWDGGHRVPFIARWPKQIRAGTACSQLTCLTDLMATCADVLGVQVPENAGEDSVSLLPLLRGVDQPIRQHVISHSIDGKFAIRDGRWKLMLCPGSGGWAHLQDPEAVKAGLPPVQLYDMKADPGETNNLQAKEPGRVKAMVAKLRELVAAGRSTPGPKQTNDVPVDIWKLATLPGVDAARLTDY